MTDRTKSAARTMAVLNGAAAPPTITLSDKGRPFERPPPKGAEGEGFEPSIRLTTDNGFRDRRIRPLCHPSEAEKEGFEPSMQVFTHITP